MSSNVYYYFHSIYGNSDEPVICIDENLNIIFATSAAYDVFGLKKSPILHLNCVFMRKYLKYIKAAYDKGEFSTLNFESVNDDTYKKCLIIPSYFENEKYAVLLFANIASEQIDNLRKFELKRAMSAAESTIASSTSIILSHAQLMKEKCDNEKSLNIIFKNVLNIRRIFSNLSILTSSNSKNKISKVIDINEYLKYITGVIASQIGEDKVIFILDLCHALLTAEIEPRIFEILICNLVSNSVKFAVGKSKITIQTASHDHFNLVVVSDNGIGCKDIDKLYEIPDDASGRIPRNFHGVGISVIRKIVTDHGGQIYAIENRGGGVSVGFTLPKVTNRKPILHSPAELEDNDENFSTTRVELAEFLDVNNLKF